jgi:hypothetical protein
MLWFLDKLLAGVLYFLVYGTLVLYVLRYIETRHRIEIKDGILFFVGLIGLTIRSCVKDRIKDRRDGVRELLFRLHSACDAGDRRACIQFGMIVGENREHRAEWQRDHPELFGWER